jgi:hypothetical protein
MSISGQLHNYLLFYLIILEKVLYLCAQKYEII